MRLVVAGVLVMIIGSGLLVYSVPVYGRMKEEIRKIRVRWRFRKEK